MSDQTVDSGPAKTRFSAALASKPNLATGALVLGNGAILWGLGLGAEGRSLGEVCFNTSMSGYQEVLMDPSYAGQIITFTFPHIGNVGTNDEDSEALQVHARGCILRCDITQPSNYRAAEHLSDWMRAKKMTGIAGVDTRALTRMIRDEGAPHGVVVNGDLSDNTLTAAFEEASAWAGLKGLDLAKEVTTGQTYKWSQTTWSRTEGFGEMTAPTKKVVAVDFGAKLNILRSLAVRGCDVTVVPASATAEEILSHAPDGVFLSNGPGDPAATGAYAIGAVQGVLESGTPIFGICLGHQILAQALGAKTSKLHQGHRGGNHPVKDLQTGKVEITSQNHGFAVELESLPSDVEATHVSLFDGTNEGIRSTTHRAFSVQYHPEASPGPHDSHYLFDRFMEMMDA
jgi:carbamoyl-phosphate synthase small subunit